MNARLFALAAALLSGYGGANASINCSLTKPAFTLTYIGSLATAQSSVIFTCTRTGGDSDFGYEAEIRNNGSNPTGSTNRARLGASANYISYDLYTNSSCSTLWDRIQGTFAWAGASSKTLSIPVWACAPAGQTGKPVGTYTDSVLGRFRAENYLDEESSFPVTIQVPGVCTVTVPADLNFNYTAFGPLVNSSTTFAVNCNNGMPYSMAVAPTTGTVVGLDYLLSVNTASQTGNGAAQTQTINGAMAAGQAGLCAGATCTGSQPHSITISY